MDLGLELDHKERGCIESCKRALEMIAAWLRGDDNAREQTWSTLVDALKSIDQNSRKNELLVKECKKIIVL